MSLPQERYQPSGVSQAEGRKRKRKPGGLLGWQVHHDRNTSHIDRAPKQFAVRPELHDQWAVFETGEPAMSGRLPPRSRLSDITVPMLERTRASMVPLDRFT
jgi:hypothetical protein